MGSTQFGKFHDFCRDSTLPICNLFTESQSRDQSLPADQSGFGGCRLRGIPLSGDRYLENFGSIFLCGVAILVTIFLIWKSNMKKAAVGRREFQLFLLGFILIEICEIFTVGGFPLDRKVRVAFTGIHLGAIAATSWVLLMNGVVGYQLLDDGTPTSLGLLLLSGGALFVGTAYIALDTGYSWTRRFDGSLVAPNRNIALYILYQLFPLVCLVGFFILETYLVLRVLGERRPMQYLVGAALLFAIGQIFQYVISTHICQSTSGKINGALFETFFTLLSIVLIWVFWSSITEDDWPVPPPGDRPYA